MATQQNKSKQSDKSTSISQTYEEAKSSLSDLNAQQAKVLQPTLSKLLEDIKKFNDKYKIETMYGVITHNADIDHCGIEISKPKMPRTLLNFLLSKYLEANKDTTKKPSASMLLAMLYKHQKFNVRFKKRMFILPDKNNLPKQTVAKEDDSEAIASMVSTPDNTTLAPEVGCQAGDLQADLGIYVITSPTGKVLKKVADSNSLELALQKLGKKWYNVLHNGKVVRVNS